MNKILTSIDMLEGFVNDKEVQEILPGGCVRPLYGIEPPKEEEEK